MIQICFFSYLTSHCMCDKAKVGQALLHLIRQQVRKHMKTQKTLHMLQIARKHTSFILPRYMPSWTKFLNPSPEHLKRDFGGQGNQPASDLHGLDGSKYDPQITAKGNPTNSTNPMIASRQLTESIRKHGS